MKRKRVHSVVIIILLVIISACGNKTSNNSSAEDTNAMRSEIKGIVTALDGNLALIVSKDANHPDNKTPTAVWVNFVDVSLQGVQIGNQVKVVTDGMILESYPMQTKGHKLEIVSTEAGKADLEGTVTALEIDDKNITMEVDGIQYNLLPFSKYFVNTDSADVKDIKVGDKVEVWFPGYQVLEERLVTQVKIVR
jgi:Cu/Ag efflux protein CusF